MHRRECGDSPKTFCSTENRPSSARRSAIGIALKNRPAVLQDKYGNAPFALGIFCRARAIISLYFRKCWRRCCKEQRENRQRISTAYEATKKEEGRFTRTTRRRRDPSHRRRFKSIA